MATKINADFYGAENTFVTLSTDLKRSVYSLGSLMSDNIYTGGSLDKSAAPWGIGKSSASSDYEYIAQKSDTWTINKIQRNKGNTPLFLYYKSDSYIGALSNADLVGTDNNSRNYECALYQTRINPNAVNDNGTLKSTLSIDNGASINLANVLTNYPVTYLNYQNIRLYINHVYYKPVGSSTIQKCTMNDIEADRVFIDKIVYFDCYLSYNHATGQTPDSAQVHLTIGGNALSIPEIFKPLYYQDAEEWVRPWRFIEHFGYWYIDEQWYSGDSFRYANTDVINYKSSWETLGNSNFVYANPVNVGWSTLSDIQQNFNGLVYHWESGLSVYASDQWNINEIKTGDTYASGTVRSYAYLVVDEKPDGMSDNAAYFNAVLHECSFLGFPIVLNHISVYHQFGENDVYLPIFDSHMITTGDYKNGSDSLSLPNALWTDIFSDSMPVYDPEYDPDPQPDPSDDFGSLTNKGLYTSRFPSNLNVWCFYNAAGHDDISTVISAINNLYITDPDGNAKWQLDFKGTNPSDYIVGLYATPLIVPHSDNPEIFTLGPVDFDGDISTYKYAGNGYFTFGSIDLYGDEFPLFNDFRDYAPYTQLELYIPLCGTVTLDTAFFIGHSVTVDMYYDILTMSCTAAIYRDNKTLYKTVNGTLGALIPITSLDMGSYQNSIKALESAQKQNDMRLMTSVMTMGISAAVAVGSGGASLITGAGALTGAAGIMNTVEQGKLLDYQLDHTAPSVAQTGTAEPQNSFCVGSMYPFLFIKRAKLLSGKNDNLYSKTVGNACCINDYIGGTSENPRTGLVVCSNINTTGITNEYNESPTVEEINAIKEAAASGIIV